MFLAATADTTQAKQVNVWLVAGQSNAPGLVDDGAGGNPIVGQLNARYPGHQHVTVLKARGGTALHPAYNIRPSWHPSVSDGMYDELIDEYNLTANGILAAGDTPVLRGLFWMQGFQDAKTGNASGGLPPPPQPAAAECYDRHLQDLIAALRSDTGVGNLPVVIGETTVGDDPAFGDDGSNYTTKYGTCDNTPIVQAHQRKVARLDPNVSFVDTDLSQLGPDHVHYSAAGHAKLAHDMVQAIPESSGVVIVATGLAGLLRRRRRATRR